MIIKSGGRRGEEWRFYIDHSTEFEHVTKAAVFMKQSATQVEQGGDEEMRARCFKAPNCKGQTVVALTPGKELSLCSSVHKRSFRK